MAKNNKDFFKAKNSWSEIKDKLLGSYITPYFQKVLMTGQPIFYVDCFAGKGKFSDGKPGSPRIALEARDACLAKTTSRFGAGRIDTCFIDLNHAQELAANTSDFSMTNGTPLIISGKYEDEIEKLLLSKRGMNVFLYIDPYGIRALDFGLFSKFKTYGFRSIEMLVNFNSFGFFRDACRVMKVNYQGDEALNDLDDLVEYDPTFVDTNQQSEILLNSIAGGEYWKSIVAEFNAGKLNGYQAEKRLSAEYKQTLRQIYGFVLDMPIRLKPGQRPKYRMIHVCDHEDGCFLMAQNMQKRKDELFINIQQNGQYTLFDLVPTVASTVENELISSDEIKVKLTEYLSGFSDNVGLTNFLAGFVNEYGLLCEFKMIYSILDELAHARIIEIERVPALTEHLKPSTFWEEKKGKRVIIRRRVS